MSICKISASIVGIAAAVLLATPSAQAAMSRNWVWCANDDHANLPDRQIEGCTAIINAATETRKNMAIAYNNRGNGYADKKQYERALPDYDHALRLSPDYSVGFRNRGLAYNGLKQYDKAISDYNEAIRLDPRYGAAFNSRGSSYYSKKNYDRAIADYSEAIRIDPNSAFPFRNRGLSYVDKG